MYLPKPGDAHVLDLFSLKGKVAVVTGTSNTLGPFNSCVAFPLFSFRSPCLKPETVKAAPAASVSK